MRTINLIPQEGKRQVTAGRRCSCWSWLWASSMSCLLGVVTVWRQGAVDDAEAECPPAAASQQ